MNKQRNNEANANENENTSALINITQEDDSDIFELLQNLWINNLGFITLKSSRFYLLLLFLCYFYWIHKCS